MSVEIGARTSADIGQVVALSLRARAPGDPWHHACNFGKLANLATMADGWGMTEAVGLRERKKAATRAALSQAAWSLMLDHGLEAATPEAIAQAAQVSPRTFRNYFSSREEAIVDDLVQRYLAFVNRISARPIDESIWDSLSAVLASMATEIVGDRGKVAVLMRIVAESPAMRAQLLLVTEQVSWAITKVIAERTGTDPEHDLSPRLMASAVGTAISAAVSFWARNGTAAPLSDVLRDCLAQLRAGLPVGDVAPAT